MTIKQLADQLGVSKDKIKYQVRKLPSEYFFAVGNITHLTQEGIELISENIERTEMFTRVKTDLPSGESGKLPGNYPLGKVGKIGECHFYTHLLGEVEVLRGQLEMKDKQIETLTKILDNIQQTLPDKKQSFWAKLFKRN